MLNNIIDGISIKLDKTFGESYTIYSEDVEQGINEPCFFIVPLNPSKVSYPSGRTLKKNSFDVHYFPKSNDKSFEIDEVAEMLLEELEYIEIDGDLVRGTNMNFEIVDNVLHFFVDYNYFTIKNNDIFAITHPGDKGGIYIEEVAKAAENTNTKLEINSSHEFLNVEQLRKIKDYNVKFIIGSDAHIPQNVGNFDLALETVNKSSLDKSLIENILV